MRGAARLLVLLAVVLLGVLWYWQHLQSGDASFGRGYQPRELVSGGNQPPAPRMSPESEQLSRAGLEAAAQYAASHGSRALIVSRHGYIVFERYWQGSSFDTLSDGQAFTPLLAALASGAAVSHRIIGWPDEPIGAFISEWSQDPRGAITVRNLLQMSSGLAPPAANARNEDLLAATLATPVSAAPGTVHVDKPSDPQLLSLLLERATHQRYASYLSQAIWRRIGAADAWLWLDRAGGEAHADCCMMARQGDWIRLGELLLRDGNYRGEEVIRPGWVTLMRAPSKADAHYGAFVHLGAPPQPGSEPYAARDVFVVEGSGANRLWLVPSLQLAILCTGETSGRDSQWDDTRVPNLIMHAATDYAPPRPTHGVNELVPGHQP
jgi:CubicO group peptidase (beta-lactamase class C family)